jgi:hypothetical protein
MAKLCNPHWETADQAGSPHNSATITIVSWRRVSETVSAARKRDAGFPAARASQSTETLITPAPIMPSASAALILTSMILAAIQYGARIRLHDKRFQYFGRAFVRCRKC